MTKRTRPQSSSKQPARVADNNALKALEQQVIAVAEQLGRIAGTAQASADDWLEQPEFHAQLTRIRRRAGQLLGRLVKNSPGADGDRQARARAKSREKVAAPGKKHRKAPAPSRGVKHSEQGVTKALATRRRKTARPRQG
jgi:hypothetical protein